ncbi:DUF4351 domain-containing protein, partial [Castellaniella hirudinis]|uniref:DUF4351 domain-containing protein n=1 Tax=Castellaniella hirudinis TaxID=1144617 RepID=UPI0039C2FB8A
VAMQVYRLIEWMIALPEDLEAEFLQAVEALTKENEMTYVTLIERAGRDKWFAEGLVEGKAEGSVEGQSKTLLLQMQRRFGPQPDAIARRIRAATAAQLETWLLNILDATELDDVFRD